MATIYPFFVSSPYSYPLEVGDVASQDILAPKSLSYTSGFLSEQAVAEAEGSVQDIYLPADPAIARQQIEYLQVVLAY
ncbi:MAG: hypothetical protein MUO76_16225, partial [Anaerolineaceae bacterium]|nr:hypothetical protein [Anaerolineaceae bacterium]